MQSQESEVLKNAGSEHPDVEVGEADRDEAGPGEDHVALVEKAKKAPSGVARRAEGGAGETIEFAANDMPQRVAGEGVSREKDDVHEHDQSAKADAEFATEIEGSEDVIPEKTQENDGEIEKITMNILQDEGKRSFATIVFADRRLADGAGRWIEKEGAIVGFAIVIAGGAKTERRAEDEEGGRKLPPTEREKRRIKRREIRSPFEEPAFEGAGGGVKTEAAEENDDWKKFEPPGVAALGLTE
jgi:hypothetical protein